MTELRGCEYGNGNLYEFIEELAVASAMLTFDKSGNAETKHAIDTASRLDASQGIGTVALGPPRLQILNGDTQHAIS